MASAIPPNVPVFRVPHLRSSWGDLPNHNDNVESYVRRISELLGKAKRARVNRDWHQREALGLREQLQRYVAFFDLTDVTVPESGELDALQAWIAEYKPRLFRWHVAGDILSTDYLRGMRRIADANPQTHFLAFTKAFDIVNCYEDREAVPGNLVIVFSAWPGMRFDNPHRHRVAWMQDGTETRVPQDAIRCPGNCETCGLCYELPRLGRDVVFYKH